MFDGGEVCGCVACADAAFVIAKDHIHGVVAVRIIPGMIAEIDILAKRRRVIDYLLQPLERVRARAFQE